MAYTADQQAKIDAANAKVAAAQSKHDSALSGYNSAYGTFCNGWWNYLTDCDVRDVQSKWVDRAQAVSALYTFGLSLLFNKVGTKKWSKPTSCENAVEKGILLTWVCKRGKGDCIKSDTCERKVAEYNSYLTAVNTTSISLASAKLELDSAQQDLKDLLDTISGEVQGDPAFQNTQAQIAANAKANKLKWIFAIVVVVIIAGGIFAYFKWFRK